MTTPMLNLALRSLAAGTGGVRGRHSGAIEATGRLFDEFSAAGLEHDADSYNAVIEACVNEKKVREMSRLLVGKDEQDH